MLKKILSFRPGAKRQATPTFKLNIIPRDAHPISRSNISDAAKKVLYRLNESGFEAYLVGGSVRDLLLGGHPKDFDVATNATPEEVHRIFRNSRLIGRRFKLVHVLFGRDMIEVATFRAGQNTDDSDAETNGDQKANEHGLLTRDNVYGNKEEDALRRDFTINALYYCIKDFSVHDYANGLDDLKHRQLRLIGEPHVRYREDPVRMLRAVRFAAKLNFNIVPETGDPIRELAPLMDHVAPARLFDEVVKLFAHGYGVATFDLLVDYNLLPAMFPQTSKALQEGGNRKLITAALANTDERVREGKSVTPAFLYAALLWPAFDRRWQRIQANGVPPYQALHQAADETFEIQSKTILIPRRFSVGIKEIWELQWRLARQTGKRAELMVTHPRFRAGYDFLLIREAAGEKTDKLGAWWTHYIAHNEGGIPTPPPSPRRHSADGDEAKPRRRRRRKPR